MQAEIKQHPILFSTPMVQAILAGRKTMTRRTKGLGYINSLGEGVTFGEVMNGVDLPHTPADPWGWHAYFGNEGKDEWYQYIKCPYGNIGDVLWVRETFIKGCFDNGEGDISEAQYWYKADNNAPDEWHNEKKGEPGDIAWKPSIHMPYIACRLFLRITDIRVERLQDITEADAINEGIESNGSNMPISYRDYLSTGAKYCHSKNNVRFSPIASFCSLWESINGLDSLAGNPWVWVISFERIDKPE
jgi:hypothetical protein